VTAAFVTRTPEQLRAVEAVSMEPSLDLIARFLQPGDTVYDVGSNLGVYSILLAKAVGPRGTVIAFEPHHETYEQLLENLRLNGLENVRAFEKALGERAGEEKLFIGEVIANFSLLRGAIAGSKGTDMPFERVQVVRGDEFVEAERLPIPKAVKVDVEGFEYSVLKGFQRTLADPRCEMVCCEIHPKFLPVPLKPTDITNLLMSLGYSRIEGQPTDGPYHLVSYKG
jgi:FkbM family methyltransferase